MEEKLNISSIKTGILKYDSNKGYYISYDPKCIYGYYGVEEVKKIFYSEIIVNPRYNKSYESSVNCEVNFKIESSQGLNEGSFHYAEIIEC
jgi:hypothetical protein